MGNEEIIKEIEDMSVKNLADLVEMIEERFDVSAAMAAPTAVAPAAGAEGEGEEGGASDTFKVVITNAGQKKIQVIKALKEITGKGLKDCKALVDDLPATVKEGIEEDEGTSLREQLEEAGAEVELQ